MKCPMKFNRPTHLPDGEPVKFELDCELSDCAWWNDYFGKCVITIDSYLKGLADHRLEVKQSMRDRY